MRKPWGGNPFFSQMGAIIMDIYSKIGRPRSISPMLPISPPISWFKAKTITALSWSVHPVRSQIGRARSKGAYTVDQFVIDWDRRAVRCPEGTASTSWHDYVNDEGKTFHKVTFPKAASLACKARSLCTKAKQAARRVYLHPRRQHEALQNARDLLASDEGKKRYARRAGVEGTISQAVRACGARRSRYAGLVKTHLQQVATAAAINLDRLAAWLVGRPQETTRTSRFAALAA